MPDSSLFDTLTDFDKAEILDLIEKAKSPCFCNA